MEQVLVRGDVDAILKLMRHGKTMRQTGKMIAIEEILCI